MCPPHLLPHLLRVHTPNAQHVLQQLLLLFLVCATLELHSRRANHSQSHGRQVVPHHDFYMSENLCGRFNSDKLKLRQKAQVWQAYNQARFAPSKSCLPT